MPRHFLPSISFATVLAVTATTARAQAEDFFSLAGTVLALFDGVARLLWVLAIMLFFWGVVKFIANAEDSAEREKGKQFMLWGIIAFVVLVSLWGIVGFFLTGTFGISTGGTLEFIDKSGNIVGDTFQSI